MSRDTPLRALADRLGWSAHPDIGLLEQAMVHASVGDGAPGKVNNERLEFLGDRVLGLLATEALYIDFPKAREGQLAQRLNALVAKAPCARVARRFDLGSLLILSKGEEATGGRDKESILADAMEAVMAACFLGGGLAVAREAFARGWAEEMAGAPRALLDPKNTLQEWAHRNGRGEPVYSVMSREGPDHAPVFRIKVTIKGKSAEAVAGAKQEAERLAAARLLETVGIPDAP